MKQIKYIIIAALAAFSITHSVKAQSPTPSPSATPVPQLLVPAAPSSDQRATQIANLLGSQVNFTAAQIKGILVNGASAVAAHGTMPALPAVTALQVQTALGTVNLGKLNAAIVDLGGTAAPILSSVAKPK